MTTRYVPRYERIIHKAITLALLLANAGVALAEGSANTSSTPVLDKVRHGYIDSRYGQLLYATAAPKAPSKKLPLIMLHQSPTSSAEFGPLILEMGNDRIVIAPDTPGQGGSDGPATPPSIDDYAATIAAALKSLGYGPNKPVDVLGNHTGAFIAVELAIREPKMVHRVALAGVYVVEPERYERALRNLVNPADEQAVVDGFCEILPRTKDYFTKQGIPASAWVPPMIDSLRPLTRREFAHDAAFRYSAIVRERLPLVTQPVTLLGLRDDIYDATLASKPFFKNLTYIDLPDMGGYAFAIHPQAIATLLRKQLD